MGCHQPKPDTGQRRAQSVMQVPSQPVTLTGRRGNHPVAFGLQGSRQPKGMDNDRHLLCEQVEQAPVSGAER